MNEDRRTGREGRVALITGGGTGVGAATARLLAARCYHVALNYSRSAAEAEATAVQCRDQGVEAMTLKGDVSADADCRRMVDDVVKQWGRIDALVNSAGATQFTRFSDLDNQNAADFQRVYAVNLIGAYQMARAAAPALRESGRGAIVNVSSIAALNGNGSSIAYVTSKGALNTLTLTLARMLAPEIRVNAVLPGLIDSRWFIAGIGEEAFETMKTRFAEASALGEVCTPEDVAEGIVYLAAEATKTTGQFLTVDAGFMLGRPPKVSK